MISLALKSSLEKFHDGNKNLVIITGAGISVASGIPTFRGPEGFWTIGSENYKGPDIGTLEMFKKHPEEVWKWFLFRKGICEAAKPNEGHFLVNEFAKAFPERFHLVTQNVDGLHEQVCDETVPIYRVHGDLTQTRCWKRCTEEKYPFPKLRKQRGEPFYPGEMDQLTCPKCGDWLRPNVLWFDEYYNERDYKWDTAQGKSKRAGLMIVVGTSGSTTAPVRLAGIAAAKQGVIVNIDPNEGFFSRYVDKIHHGHFLQMNAEAGLRALLEALLD